MKMSLPLNFELSVSTKYRFYRLLDELSDFGFENIQRIDGQFQVEDHPK